jgi:hypothetical protein
VFAALALFGTVLNAVAFEVETGPMTAKTLRRIKNERLITNTRTPFSRVLLK